MFKHTLLAGALTAGLITIGGTTATADGHGPGNGPFIDKFEVQETFPSTLLTDLCGFEIVYDIDIKGTARVWPHGVHVTEQGTQTFRNVATGKTLTRWWRRNLDLQGDETVSEDGILTIHFDDTVTGIPERWLDHDGKTLIKDTGYARFVGEAVIDLGDPDDPFDDELLDFHEEITTHGPHPIVENGINPEDACWLLS